MMGGASLEFVAYGLALAILSNLSRRAAWRQFVLLAGSLGFLAFFSRDLRAYLPLAGFLAYGFASVRIVQTRGKRAFIPLLVAGIFAFVWLKKYAFIPAGLFLAHPYFTLGLSYIFFRVLHMIIDAHSGDLAERVSAVSYLDYTLNFTTLVSGPIQPYQEFAAMQRNVPPLALNLVVAGRAFARLIQGFFKVNVVSLFLSLAQSSALASFATASTPGGRILYGAAIAALYPVYLYANFSGYIDIVIAIARLMRLELPENFDRPFSSKSFLIFWNRWHITLSTWLKTYVYNTLLIACMRRWPAPAAEPFIVVFAFFLTFFLIGVWHGQSSVFLCYGVLLGLGVSVNKLYQILLTKRLGRARYNALAKGWLYGAIARGITFTWFTFSLLCFWSNWHQLRGFSDRLNTPEMAAVWGMILASSTVLLAAGEALREWFLSFEYESRPLLKSRYALTVWCTTLVVITVTTVVLLNAPAPDIVYKAF